MGLRFSGFLVFGFMGQGFGFQGIASEVEGGGLQGT